jgi:5-hydroxyisourate hydrolase-like protein (transthyretin family)
MKKSMLLWAAAILIAGIGLCGTAWQPQTFANDDAEAAKRNPERRMKEFSGYCLDDQMSRVTDATVFLYRVDVELHVQKQLQSVHTDSEGRFHFDPVVEVPDDIWRRQIIGPGWYRIIATAKGKSTAYDTGAQENPHGIVLSMSKGATLSGRVVSRKGRPVKGATVWAESSGFPKPVPGAMTATTDQHGHFEIRDLCEQEIPTYISGTRAVFGRPEVPVHVHCPGFADKKVIVRDEIPACVDIQVESAAIVEGHVVFADSDKPAAGIRVAIQSVAKDQAWGDNWSYGWDETVTDSNGRYRFDTFGAGKYNIFARKTGYTVHALDSFELIPGKIKTAPDLRLIRGGFVVGKVIDADSGKPVYPDFPSSLKPNIQLSYGPSYPQSGLRNGESGEGTLIQEDGSFKIRLAPGKNCLYLTRLPGINPWEIVPPGTVNVEVREGHTTSIEFRVRKKSTSSSKTL